MYFNRFIVALWLTVLAVALVSLWIIFSAKRQQPLTWTMVNVSGMKLTGDAHLLEFPDGHRVLIDVSYRHRALNDLLPYLRSKGIDRLDTIIITHGHRNHYGGLLTTIDAMKSVKQVIFNLPASEACEQENWAGGCNYDHIVETRDNVIDRNVLVKTVEAGDIVYKQGNTALEILYSFDGMNSPLGITDINDATLILRLDHGNQSILFVADINLRLGSYLVEHGERLQATLMSAPHHGVESAAPNEFLETVQPKTVLVSASQPPWISSRGERMRKYFSDQGIDTYVSGVHGHVAVRLFEDRYEVKTER